MTRTCVICKKQNIPFDTTRSFHKFPNDPEFKAKWMQITGVSTISRNSTVCSDHFKPSAFHETNEYTVLKRLLKSAIPTLALVRQGSATIEKINYAPSECFEKEISSNEIINCVKASNNSKFQDSYTNSDDMLDTRKLLPESISTSMNCRVENCMPEISVSNGVNGTRLKRKHPDHISQDNIVKKKFRFKIGQQLYCINREDFVSDKSWNKFVKYIIIKKYQLADGKLRNLRKRVLKILKKL